MSTGDTQRDEKGPDFSPLSGVRIVDLSQYVPGAFCTLICARLGADVVKVERADSGDPLRELDPVSFAKLNAGKKSVAIDLKRPESSQLAWSLIERADVLVESFRPGVAERLGFGYESVHRRCERLTYVSISGYGQDGSRRGNPGHDVNYLALGGGLSDPPRIPPIQVADFAGGGLYAVVAILSALADLNRGSGGLGRHLDVSMTEGVATFATLAEGDAGPLLSGDKPNYALYETKDGAWLSVGALEPKFWAAFCDALERPDLLSRALEPDVRAEVAELLRQKTLSEWTARFTSEACVVPVMAPSDEERRAYLRERRQGLAERPWLGVHSPDLAPAPSLDADREDVKKSWDISNQ